MKNSVGFYFKQTSSVSSAVFLLHLEIQVFFENPCQYFNLKNTKIELHPYSCTPHLPINYSFVILMDVFITTVKVFQSVLSFIFRYMDRYRDEKEIAKEYLIRKLKQRSPFSPPPEPLPFPNAIPFKKNTPSWLKTELKKRRLVQARAIDYK